MRFFGSFHCLDGLAVLGLILALVGCSGGGGGNTSPPSPPTNVSATSQDGAVALTWNGSRAATEYRVYRDTSSGVGVSGSPVSEAPLTESAFTDASAENGTQYYYRVTAVGEGGESDPSAEVTARPFPTPPEDRP